MIKKILTFFRKLNDIQFQIDLLKQSLGRIENRQINGLNKDENNEFKVYSQSGEDGIIQWIINKINITNKYFIEFGVENYLESNTRFLALNNYWEGLVIDGSIENINYIKNDPIYWRCKIKAVHSFITAENINEIFIQNNIPDKIGILSIDVDGNDYWIFNAIENINADIIIIEYNSHFKSTKQLTIPYNPSFTRSGAHFSKIYYGASISALNNLANSKGYKLVASNRSGNNLFFVREELMENFKELSIEDAYKEINFRECHNEQNELFYPTFNESLDLIKDLDLVDLESNSLVKVKTIC
jgi:hypothetical protein